MHDVTNPCLVSVLSLAEARQELCFVGMGPMGHGLPYLSPYMFRANSKKMAQLRTHLGEVYTGRVSFMIFAVSEATVRARA
jgi:hypothetical protein